MRFLDLQFTVYRMESLVFSEEASYMRSTIVGSLSILGTVANALSLSFFLRLIVCFQQICYNYFLVLIKT